MAITYSTVGTKTTAYVVATTGVADTRSTQPTACTMSNCTTQLIWEQQAMFLSVQQFGRGVAWREGRMLTYPSR
jgi:hypothetical protein